MLGKRSSQRGMFAVSASTAGEADHLYLDFVGRDSFYGFLATERANLFRDEDFGRLYCPDNGRNSVPPSLLATALLLQAHDRVSDEEAKARADFDMRWKVALGSRSISGPLQKAHCSCFGPSSSFTTRCAWSFNAVWNTPRKRDTCKDGR